jgi:glycine cleavage system regulatory protein
LYLTRTNRGSRATRAEYQVAITRSMLDAGCSMLDARCSMLDARCSMLDARCSMLDARCSMLDASNP